MPRLAAIAIAIAVAASAGCIKSAAFECSMDSQCEHAGVAGTCEAVGACSFPDTTCSSGRRYGSAAGAHSDRCVGDDDSDIDAGPGDGNTGDGGPDAPTDPCPASYAALAGAGSHLYRLVATPNAWANQRSTCRADGNQAQLALPDNAAELQAISTLASAPSWLDISDASLEGNYVSSGNVTATFLPWAASEPDNAGNQDCVRALLGGLLIETEQCTTLSVAVCECVP
jgi:hypothetical protein